MTSFNLTFGTRRTLRIAAAALLAASAAAAAFGSAPDRADAAFSTGRCQGAAIGGWGATFSENAFKTVFKNAFDTYCADVGTAPTIAYNVQGSQTSAGNSMTARGSGAGRISFGVRADSSGTTGGVNNSLGNLSRTFTNRFAGTDEPLTPTQQAQVNAGDPAVTGDEGLVRTIPVAIGALAVPINIPDGCVINLKPGMDGTTAGQTPLASGTGNSGFTNLELARFSNSGQGSPAGTLDVNKARLRFTRADLESIWRGSSTKDTWGELVGWINDGNGTPGENADAWCQAFPIIRIKRQDDSGSTYAFKDYLSRVNPSGGWLTTWITPDTRTWPGQDNTVSFNYDGTDKTTRTSTAGDSNAPVAGNATLALGFGCATSAPQTVRAGSPTSECIETAIPTLMNSGASDPTGGGALLTQVRNIEGSIGYGSLPDVRSSGTQAFERQPNTTDDKYWVQIESRDGTTYVDPQSNANGFVAGTVAADKGANCAAATIGGVPAGDDPTTGDWSQATAADRTATGYGPCTPTYALAWDDASLPFSALDPVAEERKARTVKDFLTNAVLGQAALPTFDYSPLPGSVGSIAIAGVSAIGWQKTSGGGGGGGTGGGGTGGGGTGGGSTPAPAPAKPSNAFTAAQPRVQKGKILVTVQVPGAGNVRASATARVKRKSIALGSAASTRSSGGSIRLLLTPSAAAKKALRRGALNATVSITFTPNGGEGKTETRTIKLKKGKY